MLEGVNVISYASLMPQGRRSPTYAATGGTLYFYDPHVDLLSEGQDSFCSNRITSAICW